MTLSVYVAAASAELERAESAIRWLERTPGLRCAHDWTVAVRELGAFPRDAVVRHRHAEADLEAIRSSAVFWLLAPRERSTGAWVELGVALALRRERGTPGVLVSWHGAYCLFLEHADVVQATDENAREYLEELARGEFDA